MITTTTNTTNVSKKTTNVPMTSRITRPSDEEDFSAFSFHNWESGNEDLNQKLEIAIKHLHKTDSAKGAAFYVEISKRFMQHLHEEFKKAGRKELYLPWVRYFDISTLKKEEYPGKREDSQGYIFKKGIEDLVVTIFAQENPESAHLASMDWRIAKKILSVPNLFPEKSQLLSLINKDEISKAFQIEIGKSLDHLLWLQSNIFTTTAKQSLKILKNGFRDKAYYDDLIQAIIVGRFAKTKFVGLSNSLILGEDGGIYLLLNRLTKKQQKEMVQEGVVTKDYLEDKIKSKEEEVKKDDNLTKEEENVGEEAEEKPKFLLLGDKVVLGKGGFGSVKFALSLFRGKSSPGDVVCIKKTKSFTDLDPQKTSGNMVPSSLSQATEAIIGDYFTSGIADQVYAPHIFDLAIIMDQSANTAGRDHRKGYLMMEVFPQNTATKIFQDPRYQKWEFQKPYLQEVMLATLELLKYKIAFTDLKPDNTLYDTATFKTTIIDLGGTIKLGPTQSLEIFDKTKCSFQTTEGYRAPEMSDACTDILVNLPKALAYTCGKVIAEVVQNSDYNLKDLQNFIKKLTDLQPDKRITIEEAISVLGQMGDNSYKENVVLKQYIAKTKDRIDNNRSSISLNEDIHDTIKLHINQNITSQDPEKYKDLKTEDLFKKIDHFLFAERAKHQQVMVIFGSAGSGKSIALQIKFIEAVRSWKSGQPLPIYFNLANGIELKTIINSINAALDTFLKLQDLKSVHLYIDSFDEGLGLDSERRNTLIQDYIKEFSKGTSIKLIITCRTDYIISESNYGWFTPQNNAYEKLLTYYIAPFDYNGHVNLKKLLKIFAKSKPQISVKRTLKKIEALRLKEMITTGFMFYMILEVLPALAIKKEGNGANTGNTTISKQDIYRKYISHYVEKELKKLNQEQKLQLLKDLEFIFHEQKDGGEQGKDGLIISATTTLTAALQELGKYIAVQLHLRDEFRLQQNDGLFQALGYENTTSFKKQAIAHTLKILPLKIETKYSNSTQNKNQEEVKLGFIHDSIKNSFLLEAIQDEMKKDNGVSQILSSKRIDDDRELVRFLTEAANRNAAFEGYLRKAIDLTNSDKSEKVGIYGANSITILVAAHYSFTCQDLSNINIKGANIRNGIFSGADFTGADLSYANLANIQANGAKLVRTNLKAAKLGILPDLLGHTDGVRSVSFSSDGKYVASGSIDNTVKIWEVQTTKCLATLQGHTDSVNSVSFSSDGKYVASGSFDNTVKIWEVQTTKCLATLQGHTEVVCSVSFSSDGKYVASGSGDKTVKIWEVQTTKCLATLQGHTEVVFSVSFSSDGKYVASGSVDNTVKIWEVQTTKCLATLQDHTNAVSSVSFSSDGKYVASGSFDNTVKIWEVQTTKCLATLQGHTSAVSSVSFSSDGKYVASGSSDYTVKIWEVQTTKCLATLQGHTNPVLSVSFSSDGKYVASGSGDKTVKIWEVQTTKCLATLQGHTKEVCSVSFSSDGKYVASGSKDNIVKIWEVQTTKCLATLQGHSSFVLSVSFSSDGKYVASGSFDYTVKIWEVQTTKCLATFQDHTNAVCSVSFSSDGKYVASGSGDETVKIWEVQTTKCLATLQGHSSFVDSVSFSSDGKYVASGSYDKTVKIWEVQTTKCLITLQGHTNAVWGVSFSSDGKYVASGSTDQTVKIWEVQTTKCLATLQGHTNGVMSVSFSSDGKYVASGSNDKTVKIWEVQTTKCLATLRGHTDEVLSVNFSSDGKYVASGSGDNTVKIWRKSNDNWFCDKIFSASESFLTAHNMILKQTVISTQNQQLFKQRFEEKVQENMMDDSEGEEIKENIQENRMDDSNGKEVKENFQENIIDDTQGELPRSFTFALETAKLFELILKSQITRYEVQEKQTFVQLNLSTLLLLKPDLNQHSNKPSAQENLNQIAVDQPNSNLPAEYSALPRIKIDYNSKAQPSSLNDINLNENKQQQLKQSKQLGSQQEGKMKSMKGVANSNRAKSACCNLLMVIGQKYDNPLLNYPQVFMEISRRLGMEKTLQASDSLNKEEHGGLLDEVLQEISQEKDYRNYQKRLELLQDLLLDVTGNKKKKIYMIY